MAIPKRKQTKPTKPSKSFPLTAHNNGQWCKKIRGKIHFFGTWDDPQAALERYLTVAADLHAGRQPRQSSLSGDEVAVKDACNSYLTYQQSRVESREITPQWFDDCRRTVEHFAKFAGSNRVVIDLGPSDFERYRQKLLRKGLSGQGLGVYAMDRSVTVVKAVFAHAYDTDLIDRPMRFGKTFTRPSAAAKRKSRNFQVAKNGNRLFAPAEIRRMLDHANLPLRAMILLGINGGFGNADCARLILSAIQLANAVIEFPRPKTGVDRVVPLWPETVDALSEAIDTRPEARDQEASDLVFLTAYGRPWVHYSNSMSGSRTDSVGEEFDKVLDRLEMKRKGISFYALRHTFRTWADEVRDQHAIHRIMGHTIPGMSGIYVEKIGLERLRAVVDHVRVKLFSSDSQEDPGTIDG